MPAVIEIVEAATIQHHDVRTTFVEQAHERCDAVNRTRAYLVDFDIGAR